MKMCIYDEIGSGAAILVVDDSGYEWEHQAGGVSCSHPSEKGYLQPLPKEFRDDVIKRFYGKNPSEFEVDELMLDLGLHWKSHPYKSGMEAWIPIMSPDGTEAVLVWNNSD